MARRVWIAGASGLVGGHLLDALLHSPASERVDSLGRRKVDVEHPKLTQHLVDFSKLTDANLPPPDDVYCTLGATLGRGRSAAAFETVDLEYVAGMAEKAAAAGASTFTMVSSVAADADSPSFYLSVKSRAEREAALLPFEKVVILRPSFLTGQRPEKRHAERVGAALARFFQPLLFGPMRLYRAIPAELVALGMVGAAAQAPPGRHILHYDEILRYAELSLAPPDLTAMMKP